ncbi:HYR-like domain-containing protein, partial [Aestuariivivens insulae]
MKKNYFYRFLFTLSALLLCYSLFANNMYLKRTLAPTNTNNYPHYGLISDFAKLLADDARKADVEYFNIISANSYTITGCPGDISVNNDPNLCTAFINSGLNVTSFTGNLSWEMRDILNTLIDSGTGQINNYTFNIGTTNVIYTDNDDTCSFIVTVSDTQDPTASNPADINVQCLADVPAADPAVVTDEADNCGSPTVTFISQTADPAVNDGTITRTYRVDDGNGNTIDVFQDIVIDDTTAPVADVASLPTVTGQCSATVTAPTATDNCEGTVTGTTTDPTSYTEQGTYSITWTYDDGNGNTSTQTQTVVIDDTT